MSVSYNHVIAKMFIAGKRFSYVKNSYLSNPKNHRVYTSTKSKYRERNVTQKECLEAIAMKII